MARGGARTPANPAAVSGPGAHSQRTDGGPSDTTGRADLAAAGGPFGARKAIETQAAGAPVVTGGGGAGAAPAGGAPGESASSAFGPTERPNEPITEGAVMPQQGAEPDTEMVLRALYEQYPSSYIGRLLYD